MTTDGYNGPTGRVVLGLGAWALPGRVRLNPVHDDHFHIRLPHNN